MQQHIVVKKSSIFVVFRITIIRYYFKDSVHPVCKHPIFCYFPCKKDWKSNCLLLSRGCSVYLELHKDRHNDYFDATVIPTWSFLFE